MSAPIRAINPPSDEIARAIHDMAETMLDTCIVHARLEDEDEVDEYGHPTAVWIDSDPLRCGFRTASRREVMGLAQVPIFDSVLRLPLQVAVTGLDQVTVTHRMGRPLPKPLRFSIERHDVGVYGQTCYLKRVGEGTQA